jgi:hypothetical protein
LAILAAARRICCVGTVTLMDEKITFKKDSANALLFRQERQYLLEGHCPGNLIPEVKAFGTELSVIGSGQEMTSRSKMRSDDSVCFDKTLRVPGGLESSHAPLSLPCGLMRVLGSVVQVPVLSMGNSGHHDSFRSGIAAQFVGNDHARLSPGASQQLAKEPDGSKAIPFGLNKDVENNSVLIDSSPEIVSDAIDFEEHFIQMPFIASPSTPSLYATSELPTKLVTPAPHRFVADQHSARGHHLFYIAEADSKTEVQPNAAGNDLFRKPMTAVRAARHSYSIPSPDDPNVTMPGCELWKAASSRFRPPKWSG